MKQVKFLDIENSAIHGGILTDDGDIICGCCGGLLEADKNGKTWELLKVYKTWVDLDEAIMGE